MLVLRVMLLANKAPFVIATVNDVGYALCEIAEVRAILRELGEATACRIWRKTYDIGASRPGYPKLPLRSDLA
jgi:hypothetical protein